MSGGAIDPCALRTALGAFATGVTVVTTAAQDGSLRGFTANSFTSVSLDPPLVLVCLARAAGSAPAFATARHFAISVLAAGQRAVSDVFASRNGDRFSQVAWSHGGSGSPLIDGAAAWFDCAMHRTVDAGDHVVLIGRVLAFGHSQAAVPLGYCRGAYVQFGLSQELAAASVGRMRIGAILEQDGAVLFTRQRDGGLTLPLGTRLEPPDDPASLHGVLRGLGVAARLDFLFAVFEGKSAGEVSVYYRGAIADGRPAPGATVLVPFAGIPWEQLPDAAIVSMLRRYVTERTEDTFGIYVGDAEQGTVRTLVPLASATV